MSTRNLGKVSPTFEGDYAPLRKYNYLEVVYFDGSSFVSLINDNEIEPIDDKVNWMMVARHGHDFKFEDFTPEQIEILQQPAIESAQLADIATQNANQATQSANTATQNANQATQSANTATQSANQATATASDATERTIVATTNARNATQNAIDVTNEAEQKIVDIESRTQTAINNTITATNTQVQRVDSKITEANTAITATNTATTNANTAAAFANSQRGWSSQFVFEEDGVTRLVMKLNDYVGGTGTKPTNNIGQYLTSEGTYTTTKANGANFRGVMQIGSSTVVGGYKVGDTLVVSADGTLNVKLKVREYLNLDFFANTSTFLFATENARANITDVFIEGVRLNSSQYEVIRLGLIRVKSLPKSVVLAQSYNVTVIGETSTEPQEFITEWEITDADKNITLPMTTAQTSNLIIDWGDGTVNNSNTRTYTTSGKKIVSIKGAVSNFRFNNSGGRLKILNVFNWGGFNINTDSVFYGCENLILNNVVGIPILSAISFNSLFRDCKMITTINNVNNWNVSKVTNMDNLFRGATAFNGDISNWDVAKVTNMNYMFNRATAFNGDISNWNVANVTAMAGMFNGATAFNGDISNWDVSNVTAMDNMFISSTAFNRDISNWNVSKVTNMNYMFNGATAFNGDISNWDVSNVTAMAGMFNGATAFNGDISNWDVSNVTNMDYMFSGATAFNRDISNWSFSRVTSLNNIMTGKTYLNYTPQYVTNLYRRWTEFPNIANLTISMGTCRYTPEGQQYKDILISRGNIITDGGVQE